MASVKTKVALTPQRAGLVRLMQKLNFGLIEGLVVRDGEPILDPMPRVLCVLKTGGENGDRPELYLRNYALKKEVTQLFNFFSRRKNATIQSIEIKHGLPFKVTVEVNAA